MHGGYRENAGRPSAFEGKELDRPYAMDFTPEGRRQLAILQASSGLSRNDILAHLIKTYARKLRFEEPGVVYPGKLATNIMAIRLPKAQGKVLVAVGEKTGKSWSDIGEALVRRYGPDATFPVLAARKRRKRPRRGRS